MFDKYTDNSYTAYNLTPPTIHKQKSLLLNPPYIKYDIRKNPIQMVWDPVDAFSFSINFGKNITVFEDDIIFSAEGQKPTETTSGKKGLKAYNIVEGKSWTCKGTINDSFAEDEWIPIMGGSSSKLPEWEEVKTPKLRAFTYTFFDTAESSRGTDAKEDLWIWEEDEKLDFPQNGTKIIMVSAFNGDTEFECEIQNFRREKLYSYIKVGVPPVIDISPLVTPLLVEGQYFIRTIIKKGSQIIQQSEIPVTIICNPERYVDSESSEIYENTFTTQLKYGSTFTWEPLGTVGDEYVWIPLVKRT